MYVVIGFQNEVFANGKKHIDSMIRFKSSYGFTQNNSDDTVSI